MRLQTYYLVQYLSMGETNITSMHELMPFDWDNDSPKEELIITDEDWIRLNEKYCGKHLN
jgi:hypothetical protein